MKTQIIVILFICISANVMSGNRVVISNLNLVEIQNMIHKIPIGLEKNYGLKDRNQIDSLLIGEVISMYYISDSSQISKGNAFLRQNDVLIPILLNSDIVFFIKGIVNDNRIVRLLGLGANLFAREFNRCLKKTDLNKKLALLQDYSTDQSFLFSEDELQIGKEFNLFAINSYSTCYSCETINDRLVNSTFLIKHLMKTIKNSENEKSKIITR